MKELVSVLFVVMLATLTLLIIVSTIAFVGSLFYMMF